MVSVPDQTPVALHFTPLLDVLFQKKKKSALSLVVKKNQWEKEKICNCDCFAGVTKNKKIKTPTKACFEPSYLNSSACFQAFTEIPRQSNGSTERVKTNNRTKDFQRLRWTGCTCLHKGTGSHPEACQRRASPRRLSRWEGVAVEMMPAGAAAARVLRVSWCWRGWKKRRQDAAGEILLLLSVMTD